jgi:hypothetical protein
MKNRQYQSVQLSKKESELIEWLQKGEHNWSEAFYIYANRRKVGVITKGLKERSWFNKTLRGLHTKGLCKNVGFVLNGLPWRNPGIKASKSNFVALTLQETNIETKQLNRPL